MISIFKTTFLAILFIFSSAQASETIYFDGENGGAQGWHIYDSNPAGATMTNALDADSHSHTMVLLGINTQNGYAIGNWSGRAGAWENRDEKILSIDMKYSEYYAIFVILDTSDGRKYLYYSSQSDDRGLVGDEYIHIGLGRAHMDGNWHTETFDLEADLHRYAPDVTLNAVNGVLFRGSGSVDNIKLSNGAVVVNDRVIEDAEDGDTIGWSIYDSDPDGATVSNSFDANRANNVIELQGTGVQNGFILGNWSGRAGAWNERERKHLTFSMNFDSNAYGFFVTLQTTNGLRYLYYTAANHSRGLLYNTYSHHGLGAGFGDGSWHTFSRDLQADLQVNEPNNSIISIDGLLIRGSGLIDGVILSQGEPDLPPEPSTMYEDFESGNLDKWDITHDGGNPNSPPFMEVRAGFDGSQYSGYFAGSGLDKHNIYRLAMHNDRQFVLELDITGKGPIWHGTTGVVVNTDEGARTMIWNAWINHAHMGAYKSVYGSFVLLAYPHPYALQKDDPLWGKPRENLHLRLDLEERLQVLEPGNHIRSVEYFIYGASTLIDNIALSSR